MNQQTLIVTGGGAAGFFCAVNAARMHPDLKVIIIEKTSKLLSKVRVSGGGRCNVTHHCFEIPELLKKYPARILKCDTGKIYDSLTSDFKLHETEI